MTKKRLNWFEKRLCDLEMSADRRNYDIDSDEDYIRIVKLITDAQFGDVVLTTEDLLTIAVEIGEKIGIICARPLAD